MKDKANIYIDSHGCLVIGWTTGLTIGDPIAFSTFIKKLQEACKGKKLSSIASDAEFVGLSYASSSDSGKYSSVEANAEFAIVCVKIANNGTSLIFYIDPIKDFIDSTTTEEKPEYTDEWI